MNRPTPPPNGFHRPAEAAAMLHCSEWWLKKQCRQHRIPYAWIGGSYLFTDEHIAEIIRRFEVRPANDGAAAQGQGGYVTSIGAVHDAGRGSTRSAQGDRPNGSVTRLRARPPRRTRTNGAS